MRALVVRASLEQAEVAADLLWSLGVVAVEERPVPTGGVELWTSVGDSSEALAAVEAVLAGRWEWSTVEVDDSVVDTWREFARPVTVDERLVVLPAWLDLAAQTVPADAQVLTIEPGPTFGLGDHPTTRLSLVALRRESPRYSARQVLDVGCGSGILSIAAVRFGAAAAVAIDISPAAVPVTTDNASRNGVGERVEVSTTPLASVQGRYSAVVANILAPALIELADDLERVLAVDGVLIVSGVLDGCYDHVVDALAPLVVSRVDTLEGWAAITLVRS